MLTWKLSKYSNIKTEAGREFVDDKSCYYVEGLHGCFYFVEATELAQSIKGLTVNVSITGYSRDAWNKRKEELYSEIVATVGHKTSPFVYYGCANKTFIGGYDSFAAHVKTVFNK